MYCSNCKSKIISGKMFCSKCGTSIEGLGGSHEPSPWYSPSDPPSSPLSSRRSSDETELVENFPGRGRGSMGAGSGDGSSPPRRASGGGGGFPPRRVSGGDDIPPPRRVSGGIDGSPSRGARFRPSPHATRTLTIINTKGMLQEINLEEYHQRELNIGRNADQCDIVIGDEIISKVHGKIVLEGTRTYYQDNDSSNGTFLGDANEKQLLRKSSGFVELFDKSVLRIGNLKNPDKMVLILYRSSVEGESWKQFPVVGDSIMIGRMPSNQIVLNHPGISRIHCQIQRHGDAYVLYAKRQGNGTLVNGQRVVGHRVLKDKDLIQILDYQLFFSNECIYYKTLVKGISLLVNGIDKFVGSKGKRKQILRNVSCEIKGNEFVAIIGGSGAGKTTLMNAISGFEPDFIGNVYCNGIDIVSQFQSLKNIIGFVPQQDIIYENLTLWRMLYYTAKLKMSEDTGKQEIHDRIKEVLEMVELQDHQNTYIRKLSGGQKKRASIAVELLADPKLFFLDEPTSGLDPGTEKNLMITLNSLAKSQNKTIVMVTHTTENLHLCDKIIFMGPGGRLCFCGNVEDAKAFYGTDSLVDVFNMIAENPEECERRFAIHQRSLDRDTHFHRYKSNRDEEISKRKNVSALRQFNILSLRYGELLLNDKARLAVLMLQPFLIAILLYMVADEYAFDIYESTRAMLFAVSCSGIWIGLFNSIQEICKERVIIKREYMANLKLPVYISSKFLLQAILGMVQAFILTSVFLWLVSASREGIFFEDFTGEIFITMWLTILASIAMGFVISALVTSGDKAMAVAPFVLIIQLLFSGILFPLEGAGELLSYVTVSRWSVSALGRSAHLNELDGRMQEEFPMIERDLDPIFEATSTYLSQTWSVLLIMTLLFMVVSTVSLRRIAKDRR